MSNEGGSEGRVWVKVDVGVGRPDRPWTLCRRPLGPPNTSPGRTGSDVPS